MEQIEIKGIQVKKEGDKIYAIKNEVPSSELGNFVTKKDLDNYRVNFDVFTSEQSLYDKGEVENVLNQLKK